jgi:hypothetical protein
MRLAARTWPHFTFAGNFTQHMLWQNVHRPTWLPVTRVSGTFSLQPAKVTRTFGLPFLNPLIYSLTHLVLSATSAWDVMRRLLWIKWRSHYHR